MSLGDKVHSPGFQKRFHACATLTWLTLAIPTVIVWKDSILWVALMSVWANIAAHWAAYQGAAAEDSD
jgi:hypothetical protein